MRAIDFACRLLLKLERDAMPAPAQRVLIALAAGLETSRDLAEYTVLTAQHVAAILGSHIKAGLVTCDKSRRPQEYFLSQDGRTYLHRLLDFLPSGD